MASRVEGFDEKILACAKEEFLEKGYTDASIRTILSTTLPRRKSVVLRSTLRTLSTRLQIVTMHTLTAR